MDTSLSSITSIIEKIQNVIKQVDSNITDKIKNFDTNIVEKGISAVETRIDQYKLFLLALYSVPIILLFYIIYLLNKYH